MKLRGILQADNEELQKYKNENAELKKNLEARDKIIKKLQEKIKALEAPQKIPQKKTEQNENQSKRNSVPVVSTILKGFIQSHQIY